MCIGHVFRCNGWEKLLGIHCDIHLLKTAHSYLIYMAVLHFKMTIRYSFLHGDFTILKTAIY
jgi:hypothetical protein